MTEATSLTCPDCGNKSFTLDPTAETERLYFDATLRRVVSRRVKIAAAFCNFCEFSIELTVDKN